MVDWKEDEETTRGVEKGERERGEEGEQRSEKETLFVSSLQCRYHGGLY
jgi:hypothetical protein